MCLNFKIIIIESNPGTHLPNCCMTSRHNTGCSLQWPGTRDGTSSMQVESAICGRGAEFFHGPQRDAAWLFLIGFPHWVFISNPIYGIRWQSPSWRQAANATALSLGTADPPRFRFMVSLPRVQPPSLCAVWIFIELCNIFVYCRANYFFSSSDSCFGFITFHARWYFIELCNENFRHRRTPILPPRRERGSRIGVVTLN